MMRGNAKRVLVASILLVAATACSREDAPPEPFLAGTADHVHHLWFAGQPDEADLETARRNGIDVVINLRAPSEFDWDEAAAVEELGMAYYNVPVTGPAFDPAAFAEIERVVDEHRDDRILVHCASSNRAGGWFATHMAEKHGMPEDEALAAGRSAGITKDGIVERVRAFLARPRDS